MPLSRGRRTRFQKDHGESKRNSPLPILGLRACCCHESHARRVPCLSRFTRDEDGGIGWGYLLDLREESFQCRAMPLESTEILLNFRFQIIVLLLHPELQGVNLFEGSCVGDRDRRLICKHPEPLELLFTNVNSGEDTQHPKDFSSEN